MSNLSRDEKVLYHINKHSQGLEIGPSHRPIAPKKKGFNVHIMDHMSQDKLKQKYRAHDVNIENIEEVDFVWSGESYQELTGHKKFYDWIIASHVIEHTPDLISFLNDCDEILKDDGVLSLVVPDKRYCFDKFRPITGISKIIDNHISDNTIHTPGTVAEYFLNVVSCNGSPAWDSKFSKNYSFIHSKDDAYQHMMNVIHQKRYCDVHAWCFTPHSFRLIVHDLNLLGFISLKELSFFPTSGHEFYITLGRQGTGTALERLELQNIIDGEQLF